MKTLLSSLALALLAVTAFAQTPVTLHADLVFYGDNTEFQNAFRSGETTLGAHGRVYFAVRPTERVEVRAGLFGNQRFGSEDAFEEWRPVLSIHVGSERGAFVLGTLDTTMRPGPGPDLEGPHALLPPLQVEVLAFTRPYEAGLQWKGKRDRIEHDAWLSWRALNTPSHREEFDTGLTLRARIAGPASLALQVHEVHHGGQLFASGPVGDSVAVAYGLRLEPKLRGLDRAVAEAFGLYAIDDPDRGVPGKNHGRGFFGRLSAEKSGFRAHAIVWRGIDYLKAEADTNYVARTEAGLLVTTTRRYEEVGLARVFRLSSDVDVEASGRLHWVDGRREYSYRVLATVGLGWTIVRDHPTPSAASVADRH